MREGSCFVHECAPTHEQRRTRCRLGWSWLRERCAQLTTKSGGGREGGGGGGGLDMRITAPLSAPSWCGPFADDSPVTLAAPRERTYAHSRAHADTHALQTHTTHVYTRTNTLMYTHEQTRTPSSDSLTLTHTFANTRITYMPHAGGVAAAAQGPRAERPHA
jgi:hypothetical protein